MAVESFKLSVVTPERAVWEGDVRFVALPAHDGEMGFLAGRAPIICKLDVGPLRLETAGGANETLFVDGGFAEMVGERLTVLTEDARSADELDRSEARRHLEEARALGAVDDDAFEARQHALRRARQELRLTSGSDAG